jgi:hypothetical protein
MVLAQSIDRLIGPKGYSNSSTLTCSILCLKADSKSLNPCVEIPRPKIPGSKPWSKPGVENPGHPGAKIVPKILVSKILASKLQVALYKNERASLILRRCLFRPLSCGTAALGGGLFPQAHFLIRVIHVDQW